VATTKSAHTHCVLDPGCASRKVFEVVSGRWGPLVIMALKGRKKRHGELRRELEGISQKMLIQTLRNLEHNGLVEREVYPVVPPKVEYSLTPLGGISATLARGHLPVVGAAPRGGGRGTPGRGPDGVPVRREAVVTRPRPWCRGMTLPSATTRQRTGRQARFRGPRATDFPLAGSRHTKVGSQASRRFRCRAGSATE
jgi:DNA-binding HxlR family transcriptional regulator